MGIFCRRSIKLPLILSIVAVVFKGRADLIAEMAETNVGWAAPPLFTGAAKCRVGRILNNDEAVRPAKAGAFSGSQSRQGKSQGPVA